MSIHTCHADCPCQRGEKPIPDFVEDTMPTDKSYAMARAGSALEEQASAPSRAASALAEFHAHPNAILDDRTNGIPLRRVLLAEEYAELVEAMEEGDVEHIAREMGDVLYILYGTALVYGIDLDAALEEIHRAAMDKMDAGLRRDDGKIIKPPGFVPPDMSKAVRNAIA